MAEPHTGAVYVYFANGNGRYPIFAEPIRLLGPPESQFGAAITRLGDLNHDGFEDFAVGAPFALSGGSVHIFLGAPREKFDHEAVQVRLWINLIEK